MGVASHHIAHTAHKPQGEESPSSDKDEGGVARVDGGTSTAPANNPAPTMLEAEFATMLDTLHTSQQGAPTDAAVVTTMHAPVATTTTVAAAAHVSPDVVHSSPPEEAAIVVRTSQHNIVNNKQGDAVSQPSSANRPTSQSQHSQPGLDDKGVVSPDHWRAQLPDDMHPQWLQLLGAKQRAVEEVV